MTKQYAVVFFPDDTLNVAGVGPFRSLPKAIAAADKLEKAIDKPGFNEWGEPLSGRVPQVIPLTSVAEAIEEYER